MEFGYTIQTLRICYDISQIDSVQNYDLLETAIYSQRTMSFFSQEN